MRKTLTSLSDDTAALMEEGMRPVGHGFRCSLVHACLKKTKARTSRQPRKAGSEEMTHASVDVAL